MKSPVRQHPQGRELPTSGADVTGGHAGGPVGAGEDAGGYDGLRYATIRILTVNGSRGPDGRPLGPHVFTVDNCPVGGVLPTDEEKD
jgi:hypothetical protein